MKNNGITTSEVSCILGINPHKTAVELWEEMVGEKETETTESMKIGSVLKEVAKKVWEDASGKKIEKAEAPVKGHSVGTVCGTVDGQPVLVKTAPVAWDETPEEVEVQAQHVMGTNDEWNKVTVICLVTGFGKGLTTCEIERDDVKIANIQEAVETFWTENVEGKNAPAPQNIDDCRKIWGRNEDGTTVEADEETAKAVADLKETTAKIKALEAEEEALKKTIMTAMGTNEILTIGGKKAISWKCNKDSSKVDYKGLVEALAPAADLLAEHTSTIPGARVFRVSK